MGQAESSLGAAVGERFDVIGLAGRGGMATVYRAVHRASGEAVALKIVEATDAARKRFAREAAALRGTVHPSIVQYRDHGELEDGRVFLAMEWVDGESLGTRLRHGRVALPDALMLSAKLARALAAVHSQGLVHRDVKPGNVMLRDKHVTQPVLLDFGLVKPVVGEEITSVGLAVGTPGYMAPEQARGSSKLDARADIFALACLLFRCATGERPFGGADVTAILTKLLFDAPPSMRTYEPRVASELDTLVAKMLSKNPDDRPRDANEIAATLESLALREAPSQPRVAVMLALTPAEQRPVSVVLVADAAPDAPTMVAPVESSEVLLRPVQSPIARNEVVALAETLGGVAETLANGALVVVFQDSTNARDQCVRAARCALRLKALVPEKTVALASGRAQSAGGSTGIVGEAIDRAVVTLRGPADDGVKIDAASAQLLEPRFEVTGAATRPAGDKSLRLMFERGEGLTTRTLLGAPTPCVGRETEMRAVIGALDQCIEDGGARVVAITADAGVGKSRLASEVVNRAALAHADLGVWLARGDPLFERSPLALIGKMLRELAHIAPSDPPSLRRKRLTERVEERVPKGEVLSTAEFLGEICGVAFDDEGRPALRAARSDPALMAGQLKVAFERFVVAEANGRPLMIVVEDLHWADALSVTYLQKATARLGSSSLLLLLLSRPEGEDRFPALFSEATHLRMRPLSAKAATKLTRAVLGDDAPAETIERVVMLAAGNAFYLEELIRAVSERDGDLPETVVLMAQARLQALDPEARRVLRAASVFGEAFTDQDVAALEGSEAAARWLPSLVEREVLARVGQTASYSFRHALLREAAYASLTDDDRVLGHRLAARRLETRGDRNAMGIADHYARGAEPAAAVAEYVRASEQALESGDLEGPGIALQRAQACGAADVQLGRLEGLAARASWMRGDMMMSEKLGRAALTKLRPGDPSWYEAIADLINALQGRMDREGIAELSRTLLDHGTPPITPGYARALSLSYTLVIQDAPSSTLANDLTRAIEELAAVDDSRDPLIGARVAVARAFGAVVKRHPSAAALFDLASRCFEEIGNPVIAGMQRNGQGTQLSWLGQWEEAIAVLRRVPESAARSSCWARISLGWALSQVGELDEAKKLVEQVLAEENDDEFLIVEGRMVLARLALLQGKPAEALERLGTTESAALPKMTQARVQAVAFEATSQTDRDKALAHGQAIEQCLADGVPLFEDSIYVRLMGVRSKLLRGDREGARTFAREARAMIEAFAALIEDEPTRRSYLERVRENVEMLAVARELEG